MTTDFKMSIGSKRVQDRDDADQARKDFLSGAPWPTISSQAYDNARARAAEITER